MRYLTKSRFNVALECPTRLRYLDDKQYANQDSFNDFLKALADGGHQVGALAKCLFPGGIEIRATGHDAQVAETQALLAQKDIALFEAAIRHENLFIRIDLLHKHGNTLDLYEVKAKSYDSLEGDIQIVGPRGGFVSDMKPYLYDVAFQRYVLRRAYPDMQIRTHLVMPDKASICDENAAAQRLPITKNNGRVQVDADLSLHDGRLAKILLHVLPVDKFLDQLEKVTMEAGGYPFAFAEGIEEFAQRTESNFFAPRPGSHCKSCPYTATEEQRTEGLLDGRVECWSAHFGRDADQFRHDTILDLNNFKRTKDLLIDGKLLLVEVETEDLKLTEKADEISSSKRQWLQCEESRQVVTAPVAESAALKKALASVNYPLHFIDFETARPAIPFHVGQRPYEQLLFQFSHHRMLADGSIAHVNEHLDDRVGVFPNFDAIRALMAAVGGDEGTVLHWWDHERTVLKEIKEQLSKRTDVEVPDRNALLEFIASLLGSDAKPGRLFDLGRQVHRTLFLPGTKGSSSLKKVLPALLNQSSHLQQKYSNAIYGTQAGIPSLNFDTFTWIERSASGDICDPYSLLGKKFEDPDLADAPDIEDEHGPIANGGAAMVAYGLLQAGSMPADEPLRLRKQLLRYCELDTLAMVMAWEGLQELVN